MALGFGFNKAKVLASAEKFVQQGKLPNAIAEYEKIVKEDPKDLTVLNTLGDLCARVGQNEQAANYFKKVGDYYAQDGFTVKAIAIYKKLTRLSPGDFDNIQRLGELYSQQGLFSDARSQYIQVADHLLKTGDNAQAAKVFQRILELDPENTTTQSKLADLYLKLGKKDEARNIYYTAAESLYSRGLFDAADEALGKVLTLDPANSGAQLLRGMIAADAGDNPSAIRYLEQVADLDSRPDGLRTLLRAKLQSGQIEGVEGVASKLVTVHNDLTGVSAVAQWFLTNNQIGSALNLYESYVDRFLAADRTEFEATLYPLISRLKESPEALSTMLRLLQRAGDSSHSAELMELQAHASAQKGEYKEARDLYQRLSEMEPENALHQQNYKQMLSKLGEDPATRTLSAEEAAQAFMVEELEEGGPAVHQSYDPPTERAIEAALTDAELFVSYNVPAKAIPPLEAVLPRAPRDVIVNQRLAMLYARSGRFADAARSCQVLSEVYNELGHEAEAVRYLEAARNYSLRVPGQQVMPAAPATAVAEPVAIAEAPAIVPPEPDTAPSANSAAQSAMELELPVEQASSVQEFSFDVPDHLFTEAEAPPAQPAIPDTQPIPLEELSVQATEPAPASAAPVPVTAVPEEHEIDVSSEWESMLSTEHTVEQTHAPSPAPPPSIPEMQVVAMRVDEPEPAEPVDAESGGHKPCYADAEKIQEIRFYIAQAMWDAAKKAILDLTEISPDAPEITELIAAVNAGQSRAAAAPVVVPPPAVAPPPAAAKPTSVRPAVTEAKVAVPEPPHSEPPAVEPPPIVPIAPALDELEGFAIELEPELAPAVEAGPELPVQSVEPDKPLPDLPAPELLPKKTIAAPPAPPPVKAVPAPAPAAQIPVPAPAPPAPPPAAASSVPAPPSATESPLEDIFAAVAKVSAPTQQTSPPVAAPPAPVSPRVAASPAPAPKPIKESPLEDIFSVPAKVSAPQPPQPPSPVAVAVAQSQPAESPLEDILDVGIPPAKAAPVIAKEKEKTTEDILTDFVQDMEKSDLVDFVPRAKPAPVAAKAAPIPEEPAIVSPPPAPPITPVPLVVPVPSAVIAPVNGDMRDAESTSVLSDILSELQDETAEAAEPQEDPETHYNLGIAFKEMGLLDEAIGELQKVCHSMDRGSSSFSQPIQAYTWLAQCLVDKGAPEAAVRWYQKALQLPKLDDGSRCAIYYDLAQAYEASGDKKSALANFMEVYGSNIDFRDVASRIKALKS